jgi:hypothetical protein
MIEKNQKMVSFNFSINRRVRKNKKIYRKFINICYTFENVYNYIVKIYFIRI